MINHESSNSALAATENTTAFTIEANESMFRMLTKDVYTDLVLAVIREWSTNAVDACIAAGIPPDFDVHLPTVEEQYFSVRDYGTGLSQDDLLGLYSTFGASTKRNSNTYNGTFGVGRMSGLAYAESFTVESFYKGTQHTYVIAFIDGMPTATHLSSIPTTARNGLRLTLSVLPNDIPEFSHKAESLYLYFSDKPNLNLPLDIELPPSAVASKNWQFHNKASSVLMGNVRYVIPSFYELKTYGISNILFHAPIGAVSINPGRESLSLDDKTKKWIQDAYTAAHDEYISIVTTYIASQPTVKDRINAYAQSCSSAPYSLRQSINISFPEPELSCFDQKYSEFTPTNTKIGVRYLGDSRSKTTDAIPLNRIYERSYIINDLQSNFNSAITAIQNNIKTACYILSKDDKAETVEAFVARTKAFLDALDVDYYLTSDYKQARQSSTRVVDDKVYVCNCGSSIHYFYSSHEASPNELYYYVPLSGFSCVSPETYEDLTRLHFLTKTHTKRTLVGVQQKYLAAVADLPNFVKLEDAKDEMLSKAKFYRIHGSRDSVYRLDELPDIPLVHQIRDEQARYTKFLNDVSSERIQLTTSLPFKVDVVEFTHINYEDQLATAYPYLYDIHYRLGKDVALHYINLEDSYALHSNKDE